MLPCDLSVSWSILIKKGSLKKFLWAIHRNVGKALKRRNLSASLSGMCNFYSWVGMTPEGKNARKEGENSWTWFCIVSAASLMWMWFRVCLVFVSDVWLLLKLLCIFSPDASRLWLAKRSALQGEDDMMRCNSWKSFLVMVDRRKKSFSQGQGKTLGLQYMGVHDY